MATWVANGTPGGTSATLPAGTATGDWVVCFAYRDANATPPTLPAGWTTLATRAVAPSILVAYREKDATWSAMPTFTSAGRTTSQTIRPASGKVLALGNSASQGATSTSITWAALTLNVTDGTSILLRGCVGTRPDVTIPTPANHTLHDASGNRPGYITVRKTTTTDGAVATSAVSRSDVWSTAQVEIKDIIPVAITQAAYGFYAEGTQSGSTALVAQDTAPTIDVTSGDVNAQLRVRLQSTTAGVVPSTDDFQLQYEKNASGTWTNVASKYAALYPDSNRTTFNRLGSTGDNVVRRGMSFLGTGHPIQRVGFNLQRAGTPTGSITAHLYAHTGTFGTNGVPTGTALATSTTTLNIATVVSGSYEWYYFDFAPFTLVGGTPYVIALHTSQTLHATNNIMMGFDSTPAFAGNASGYVAAWASDGSGDLIFEVLTSQTTLLAYDDPNLTDGAATTNRLGAGTGSFSAGKISEDGLADDAGWSANNYTELLYTIQLKQVDLTDGDTLRFRILRNNVTTTMTYSATPTVNVTKTLPAVTQAAYRFYDDAGTESSAAPLAAQDTPVIADLNHGDGFGALRIRLQSTSIAPLPSTDDWSLRWEKNASGTWNSAAGQIVDSYTATPDASSVILSHAARIYGQSFKGDGKKPTMVGFLLKCFGVPTGLNVNAVIYPHNGSYGNTGTGQGFTPLATSTTTKAVTSISTTNYEWHYFNFDETAPVLTKGTSYVVGVQMSGANGDGSKHLLVGVVTSSPSHGGIAQFFDSASWAAVAATDTPFEVIAASSVIPYDNPNLTGLASTTERLTGGSGTFSPGKVTEAGLAANIGFAGNDYTEALYSLRIVAADFVNGDVLRFRVYRNGATTGMTYTVVPTIDIFRDPPPPPTEGTATVSWSTTQTASGIAPLVSTVTQAAYRFYDINGFEADGAALAAQDTPITGDLVSADHFSMLRVRMQSTNARDLPATDDWRLQYQINSDVWTNVTATSGVVQGYNAPNVANNDPTTERLTGGTGTFTTGKVGENGTANNIGFLGNDYIEFVYTLQLQAALFANGDTVQFRVLRNALTTDVTYAQIPQITVVKVSVPPSQGTADASHDWAATATGVAPAVANAKLDTLVDTFDSTVDKTNVWKDSSVAVVWEAGRAKIPCTTAYAALQTELFSGKAYDLTASSIFAKITVPAVGTGTRQTAMSTHMVGPAPEDNKVRMMVTGSTLAFIKVDGGSQTDVFSAAYNATDHAWWRIREAGGTIYADTSPDSTTWTNFTTTTVSWDITKVSAVFLAGYFGTETASDVFIDNVNTVSEPSNTGTAIASWSISSTAVGQRIPEAEATTVISWALTAAGVRVPKTSVTVAHTWVSTASGKKTAIATAIATWTETLTATGKRTPKAAAIATWAETLTATGKRFPKGSAPATWLETLTAVGKTFPLATAAATWLETLTSTGKRTPKATATAAVWDEILTAAGKRTPKATTVVTHSWTQTATGIKPVVGMKQGTATALWTETQTGTGKRTPKATAPATWDETLTAAGKKVPKGTAPATWLETLTAVGKRIASSAATVSWSETLTATGKRSARATTAATWDETQTAVGKRNPKASPTATHSWTQTAQGVSPIVGVKQGTALVTHSWTQAGTGKRTPRATATAVHDWTLTAAGKKAQRGTAAAVWAETQTATGKRVAKATTAATWLETLTTTGKRVAKGTAPTTWDETLTAAGKRVARATVAATHLWTLLAQGVKPIIGVKQGTAAATWSATVVGTGKRAPKATATAAHFWVQTASGTKPLGGNATVSALWTSTSTGKKPSRGSATVGHLWQSGAVGKRLQTGAGAPSHTWVSTAEGQETPKAEGDVQFRFTQSAFGTSDMGIGTAMWNGQLVVEMQYGEHRVQDWLLVPT